MNIQQGLQAVMQGKNLTAEQMRDIMSAIMQGETTPAQIGGFLVALRLKGETVQEIAAAAKVMRELATPVRVSGPHLVDTCGTGGDASGTFNISTASAMVVAAAGGKVAKHGNRSVSSKSGSADVLEQAGVNLDLTADQVADCIDEVGVGFMFAPKHHGAMKHAIGPRRELGIRTIFNVLGPLTNPAGAPNQVLGVFSAEWVRPLAEVLQALGSQHVMVVCAEDGLDEISIGAATQVAELKDGTIREYRISPEQFGLQRSDLAALRADDAAASLRLIESVLANQAGPARDIVALNAGAALYVCGVADSLEAGVNAALQAIESGAANQKLDALIACSQRLGGE